MKGTQNLIRIYKRNYVFNEDWNLSDFRHRAKPIKDLIKDAVWGITPHLKQDRHQNRIPRKVLEEMTKRLQRPEIMEELKRCKSFDDIFVIVYESRIPNFGSLQVYDTSLRLGAIFDHYPTVVYLHQGTLEGARKLLGKEVVNQAALYFCGDPNYPYIERNVLPQELRNLEPYHIENFLCINKARF